MIRLLLALVLAAALVSLPRLGLAAASDAPRQPIAFSHRTHAGTLKLPCKMCHTNPDPGEIMTIAAPPACMKCHSTIKADSPEIRKLAGFAKSGKQVPWVRIYEIPSFVYFSHRTHLAKGVACKECHGPVATRDQLFRETDLSMTGCVNCHTSQKARVDCTACHDLQN